MVPYGPAAGRRPGNIVEISRRSGVDNLVVLNEPIAGRRPGIAGNKIDVLVLMSGLYCEVFGSTRPEFPPLLCPLNQTY